jgi:spoIIIJ-associated protein
MEWVETTGRTVEEAKELALDRLGVHEEDAEFEVVDEPRPGLFGRLRGEARVRARVRPTRPRPKAERRDRRRKPRADEATPEKAAATTADPADAAEPESEPNPQPEQPQPAKATKAPAPKRAKRSEPATAGNGDGESDDTAAGRDAERAAAVSFLEGLLTALGETGSVEVVVDGDDAELRVTGGELGVLIGPRGQTLLAVQDLTRLAAQRRAGDRYGRLRVDIGGYRERRREALGRFTEQVAAEVVASGESRALEPMSSMDRKVVHDTANELDGVETVSEGEEPFRRVIIRPTARA